MSSLGLLFSGATTSVSFGITIIKDNLTELSEFTHAIISDISVSFGGNSIVVTSGIRIRIIFRIQQAQVIISDDSGNYCVMAFYCVSHYNYVTSTTSTVPDGSLGITGVVLMVVGIVALLGFASLILVILLLILKIRRQKRQDHKILVTTTCIVYLINKLDF